MNFFVVILLSLRCTFLAPDDQQAIEARESLEEFASRGANEATSVSIGMEIARCAPLIGILLAFSAVAILGTVFGRH